MGYMVRLGLWGEGSPAFRDFGRFLEAVQVGGACACFLLSFFPWDVWVGTCKGGIGRFGRQAGRQAPPCTAQGYPPSLSALLRLPPPGAGQGRVQRRQHGCPGAGGDGHEGAGHVCVPHTQLRRWVGDLVTG